MPKRMIITLLVLVFILAVGISEIVVLDKYFNNLISEVDILEKNIMDGVATVEQCDKLLSHWDKVREVSELLMPHIEVWDISLRLAEVRANIVTGDYAQAYTQLYVARELLKSVPHLIKPTLSHIL